MANTTFCIEFFANQGLDPSGNAEGQTFLGFVTLATDASGYLASSPDGSAIITNPDTASASFTAPNLAAIPAGEGYLTATATNETTGDTSQFINYLAVPASMVLTSSADPSFFGQPITLTATVSASFSGFGTPSGSVTFLDTSTNMNLGSATLSGGTATLPTAALSPGTHVITATYAGNTTFLGSSVTLTKSVSLSVLVLDPTAGAALSLSGNAGINVAGAVVVDSNSRSALTASGNAAIKAGSIQVVGGVSKSGNATLSPAPTTGVAVLPDPLAGLAVPVASTLGLTSQGSVSLSGNSTKMISQGIYSQITVSGNASLTLNPGIYILTGGGLTVSGNASIAGSGVVFFNAGSAYNPTTGSDGGTYGSITFSGNGTYGLSAPTTGPYASILIFQDRGNTRALTLSGNATVGTSRGTIYAKGAALTFSGNAQSGTQQELLSFVVDTLTLSGNSTANGLGAAPAGTVAYTPAQIRTAYGISNLSLDGTGQTIALVDAYDDPAIYQDLDTFDSQFGLTATGPTLYQQYGPAASFLTVLNQAGQATGLPGTDPAGAGTANWEMEEALDVERVHAIAPGAQIILVEANSQSLSDLMASVATAARQSGVSVVSMSWGFPEGIDVLGPEEALYDSTFTTPGVTFVASTGDDGAADPGYPAFSPNVVAVGGTSLTLNADNSYNSETGWGYYSDAVGALIGSGGGISQYEAEPAYQQGVQATGYRTTPDVSVVADPATGPWIADPYNLGSSNPFEVVGGTSLSAPIWAGLFALANQGRVAAGEPVLNSSSPTQTQQALYALPQSDYHVIGSGSNGGYSAGPGYNLVTGLGTPVANLLVPDLIAGTVATSGRVAPAGNLQNANSGSTGGASSSAANVLNGLPVFDIEMVPAARLGSAPALGSSPALAPAGQGVPPPAAELSVPVPEQGNGPARGVQSARLPMPGSVALPGLLASSAPLPGETAGRSSSGLATSARQEAGGPAPGNPPVPVTPLRSDKASLDSGSATPDCPVAGLAEEPAQEPVLVSAPGSSGRAFQATVTVPAWQGQPMAASWRQACEACFMEADGLLVPPTEDQPLTLAAPEISDAAAALAALALFLGGSWKPQGRSAAG